MRARRILLPGLVFAMGATALVVVHSKDSSPEASAIREGLGRASPQVDRARVGVRSTTLVKPGSGSLTIRGRVVDARGRVSGALVTATRSEPGESLSARECQCDEHAGRTLFACNGGEAALQVMDLVAARLGEVVPVAETRSHADGSFELTGLEPDTVALWGEAGTLMGLVSDVSAGEQDVALRLESGRMLRGTVVSEDDAPLSGVALTAVHKTQARFFDTTPASDGSFALGPVPDGEYRVVAWDEVHPADWVDFLEGDHEIEKRIVLSALRTLTGRVLLDGVPVAGAEVKAEGSYGSARSSSNEDGTFAITGLRRGTYAVTAQLDAMRAWAKGDLTRRAPRPAVLSLARPGTLSGVVRDDAGSPVAGAEVIGQSRDLRREKTDSDGRFFLELPEGSWGFWALADGFIGSSVAIVHVTAGEEYRADFTLGATSVVSGMVVDEEGNPVGGGRVLARPHAPDEKTGYTGIEADGAFSFALAPGAYELTVEHDRYATTSLEVTTPAADLRVVVVRGPTIRGVVLDAKGQPVGDAQVEASSGTQERVTTSKRFDGRFELGGLERGRYLVKATSSEQVPIFTVTAEVDLSRRPEAEIVLRFPEGKDISGSVIDTSGSPLAGVEVLAMPCGDDEADCSEEVHLSAVTGADGRFILTGATAARYGIEVHSFLTSEAQEVTAEPGARDLRLVVERRATVRGRVVDEAGSPLAMFIVNGRRVAAEDGVFHQPLSKFESPVRVSAEGFAATLLPVEVLPERDVDLGDIVLTRGRRVRGLVVDADTGTPLPGTRVLQAPGPWARRDLESDDKAAIADRAGVFVLEGVPSSVVVAVLHRDYPMALETLTETDTEPTLRLSRGGTVEGTVLSTDGRGTVANVVARHLSSDEVERRRTNERGAFSFSALSPGEWAVTVEDPARAFEAARVTVPGRGQVQVELRERMDVRP